MVKEKTAKMKGAAKAVGLVMLIMVFSRLLAFVSSVVSMTFFGVSTEMDIYYYAIQFPNIIFNSFGTALATVVIPIFAGYIGTGEKNRAFKFADNVLCISVAFAALLSIAGILAAPIFPLFTRFRAEGYEFAVLALRTMFPVMIFYALNYVLQGVLQSLGRFNMPAFVSVPSSLAVILYVVLMGNSFGVPGLLAATFVGLALQGLILVPPVLGTEYRFRPSLDFKNEDIKRALRLIPPVLIGTCAYQVNMLVNITISANFKDTVALMTFVQNIILYSVLAFVYSITAVVFPKLTMLAAKGETDEFKDSLRRVLGTVIYLIIPAAVGFIVIRHEMMDFLVGWGRMTPENVDVASGFMALYAIGIISVAIKEVVDRAFYSLKDTRMPAINSVIVVGVNIAFSLTLIMLIGPWGIPLAYSISSITGTFVLLYMMKRKIGAFGMDKLGGSALKILAASGAMATVVIAISSILRGYTFGGLAIDKGIKLFIPAAAGAAVYFIATMLLGVEETEAIRQKLKFK
ncbi:MAG: murein biosynthesis integral membrane protein MurJ [Clostridia bacterium]|nr:murein biosynthesis integral membrane protein MurJ [Clostridia bacterium]